MGENIRKPRLWGLFRDFLQFGCFTFGGGWSIISQMQDKYVEREGTLTGEELLDLASVSRSIPGVMIANVAMLYGWRRRGYPGGLVCLFGLALPPFVILAALTFCYTAVRDSRWVLAAMTGIRAAVVPILISAAAALVKGAFPIPPCLAVGAASFLLYLFFDVSCLWLVVLGALAGLAMGSLRERRGENV